MRATVGRLLLGNESVNTPKTIRDNRRRFFPWDPPRGFITRSTKGTVSCRELRQVLEMAVEGDELDCKEDFMCDLKLQ
jgi:hypothetical protein